MNTRGIILMLIHTTFLFGFTPNGDAIKLNGQIKLDPEGTTAYVEGLIVFAQIENQTVGQTVTDGNGNFQIF